MDQPSGERVLSTVVAGESQTEVFGVGHEVVAGDGWLSLGLETIAYSLRQPAPCQWVAISVVRHQPDRAPRLCVGVGRTRQAAVENLALRLAAE